MSQVTGRRQQGTGTGDRSQIAGCHLAYHFLSCLLSPVSLSQFVVRRSSFVGRRACAPDTPRSLAPRTLRPTAETVSAPGGSLQANRWQSIFVAILALWRF